MTRTLLLLLAVVIARPVGASDFEREEQERYVQCLVESKAQAPSRAKEYLATCLHLRGIEDPGEAAREGAKKAWRTCLARKLSELDDGISPASEVARVVVPMCPSEWQALVASLPLPSGFKRDMADNVQKHGLDEGVRAVLRARKSATAKNLIK